MKNLWEKCVTAYEDFWAHCVLIAENELAEDGYVETSPEGEYTGVEKDDVVFLSDMANEVFENLVDDAEVIAGYYLVHHGDYALTDWEENMEDRVLTEMDKEVDCILRKAVGKRS